MPLLSHSQKPSAFKGILALIWLILMTIFSYKIIFHEWKLWDNSVQYSEVECDRYINSVETQRAIFPGSEIEEDLTQKIETCNLIEERGYRVHPNKPLKYTYFGFAEGILGTLTFGYFLVFPIDLAERIAGQYTQAESIAHFIGVLSGILTVLLAFLMVVLRQRSAIFKNGRPK